jgi:phage gpG-like protein
MSKSFNIEFSGSLEEALRFDPGRFYGAVENKMAALMDRLREKITGEKLSGQVLARRTGRLAGSVTEPTITRDDAIITGEITAGEGVLYALPHEFGGAGSYPIKAVNKQALRMMLDGKETFRKMVLHKAALKRSYFYSAVEEMREEFIAGLKQACIEGISGE